MCGCGIACGGIGLAGVDYNASFMFTQPAVCDIFFSCFSVVLMQVF